MSEYKAGDRVKIQLTAGRLVETEIKAIIEPLKGSGCKFHSEKDGADLFVAACREITIAPTECLLQFTIQTPISVEDFWVLRLEMSDKLVHVLDVIATSITKVPR